MGAYRSTIHLCRPIVLLAPALFLSVLVPFGSSSSDPGSPLVVSRKGTYGQISKRCGNVNGHVYVCVSPSRTWAGGATGDRVPAGGFRQETSIRREDEKERQTLICPQREISTLGSRSVQVQVHDGCDESSLSEFIRSPERRLSSCVPRCRVGGRLRPYGGHRSGGSPRTPEELSGEWAPLVPSWETTVGRGFATAGGEDAAQVKTGVSGWTVELDGELDTES